MSTINDLETTVLLSLKNTENLTRATIEQKVRQVASIFGLDNVPIDQIVKNIETNLVTTMNAGISLVDPDSQHNEEWVNTRKDIVWNYWNDYKTHLTEKNWAPNVVSTLDDVTKKLLGLLNNPIEASDWNRRGLVIGHVQSGKTANYIGLVARAADAGYKFIIVIAGIHNNLRKQTQQRIDEGFVGRDSAPSRRATEVGVGVLNKNRRFPITLTTTEGDFNKRIANQLGADLSGFNKPVVVVIKKNVTTLKNIYAWLKEWNTRASGDKIADIPMLMIDDEADHASINTNREDLDPTKTNALIRSIISLFRKSSYVGYTATPFANIFINPESAHEMIKDDLFPRDFIYCLDAPNNYFGATKVFIDDESSIKTLRNIDDAEDIISLGHKKSDTIENLPDSLYQAIRLFILGRAIRILRNQKNMHTSMMVNVSRFVDIQRQVRDHISHYLKNVANAVRYNYAKSVPEALNDIHVKKLKQIYDLEFSDGAEQWIEIQRVLSEAVDDIQVSLINSMSDEVLDYRKAEESKDSLNVIAVGGLSLSRGLTLEGLTVSYMYRNTQMYDTLMQMGRWFGYRINYEDICRVYLSIDSQGWYSHIAEAIEELRQQVKQMRRDGLRPKDFGLYVRSHPHSLIVTAMNKMRSAEEVDRKINLSGKLIETSILPSKTKTTEDNQKLFQKLFSELKIDSATNEKITKGAFFWENVPWEIAEQFLVDYKFHKQINVSRIIALDYLRKTSTLFPLVDIAFISLQSENNTSFDISSKNKLYSQTRAVGTKPDGSITIPLEEEGFWVGNKHRVASKLTEKVGLNTDLIKKIETDTIKEGSAISDSIYRTARNKPLLMLHILNLVHKKKDSETIEIEQLVPALGISFPGTAYTTEHDVVVANKVWLKQFEAGINFGLEEEDDYDLE